jgi:rubrerythrin
MLFAVIDHSPLLEIWLILMQVDGHIAEPVVQQITFRELIERPKSHRATAVTSASGQVKKGRRVAHANIVTSSPYLKELQEAKQAPPRRDSVKRKLLKPDSEKRESERARKKKMKDEKSASRPKKRTEEDIVPCHTCGLRFCDDNSGRRCTQCQSCKHWFHNSCQGLPEKTLTSFFCILCDN